MIPELEFRNLEDEVDFLYKMRLQLEALSSNHIRWYTHKNPAGCWICDTFQLLQKWEDIYYPKSPKNVMNKDHSSEVKSEPTSDPDSINYYSDITKRLNPENA